MFKKLKMAVAMALCLTMILLMPVQTVQAKTVSKKSVTITLTKKNPIYTCDFGLKEEAEIKVQIKVLSASGKAKDKKMNFGVYEADGPGGGMGSLFYDLKTSKLKKDKTFTSMELAKYGPVGSGNVFFDLPEGMKKLKIKVTFSSADGKKVIESVKKS